MPIPQKAKVLLVDDHPLVREWLANLLNQQPDFQVCGDAASGPEALKLIAMAKPDVAIVDISLEGGSGIDLIKAIKAARPRVVMIVLSMHDESLYAERALLAGARGYVMKAEATKKIIPAIRHVLEGKLFVSDRLLAAIMVRHVEWNDASRLPVDRLSDRELQVFQMLGRAMETRQIAEEMHIGFKTVQAFCARIKKKLMITTATQLLREAVLWDESNGGIGGKTGQPPSL